MSYRLIGSRLISEDLYVNDYVAVDDVAMNTIPTTHLCMGSTCIIPGGNTYMWNETEWKPHVIKA